MSLSAWLKDLVGFNASGGGLTGNVFANKVVLSGGITASHDPTTETLTLGAQSGQSQNDLIVVPTIGTVLANPGTPRVCRVEGPTVAAGGTYTALDISGAGYISHVMMSLRSTDTAGRNLTRMLVFVDGEATPSIDVCMCDLFCARGMDPGYSASTTANMYSAEKTGFIANAFGFGVGGYAYLTIPFSTHIRVQFVNGSASATTILGGHLDYRLTSRSWGRWGRLRNLSLSDLSVAAYAEQSLLDISGRRTICRLLPPFPPEVTPGTTTSRGNLKFFVDSEATGTPTPGASCSRNEYDSTEDYFNFSWYFWGASLNPFMTRRFCGCTRKNSRDDRRRLSLARRRSNRIRLSRLRLFWCNGEQASGQSVTNNTTLERDALVLHRVLTAPLIATLFG